MANNSNNFTITTITIMKMIITRILIIIKSHKKIIAAIVITIMVMIRVMEGPLRSSLQ